MTTKRRRLYTTEELRASAADNRRWADSAEKVGNTSAAAHYRGIAERHDATADQQEKQDARE